MFFSYLWLVLLLIAAGWVDFWCLQLALQGFLCTARCFWHVGRISLLQHVGFLWHVGRISCEPGSLSPTPDCSLTDLSQTQLRTATKKGNFPPQTFFPRGSCSKMLSRSDPMVISWSLGCLLVPRQGSCSENQVNKNHSWMLFLDSRILCENWSLTCFFSSAKMVVILNLHICEETLSTNHDIYQ